MKNLGIIFGGKSTEHDVSIVSATSVIKNLDKSKYNITPVYISKENIWYIYNKEIEQIDIASIGEKLEPLVEIDDIVNTLKSFDVVFPVLHGLGGEDGSIQGMLELFNVPYVGCGILASTVGMDKAYTKVIFNRAGLKQAEYEYIRKYKDKYIYIDKEFNEKQYNISIKEKVFQ